MNQMSVQRDLKGAEVAVRSAPYFPRRKKGISARSITVIVFLAMCALFFCVPLYVVVVTSSWHRARAGVLFRSLLPGLPVSVVGARTPGSPRLYLREAVVFPLVPIQLRMARRRAGGAAA